jgi:AcrR family transcriptional regulator
MALRQDPDHSTPAPNRGREAQRRRTRRAIVEATRTLVAEGGPAPTIDAIAAAADVSRRTVYMHFPTLDQLLLDATLGALSDAYVDTALENADAGAGAHGEDVHARVDALVTAMLEMAPTTLPLGRQIIRLTVDHDEGSARERRGQRRVGWIESAVAPLGDVLTAEQLERLVSSLAVIVGFEGMVVLRDVRGLDPDAEGQVIRWAAHALVDAMLTESGAAPAS